MAHPDASFVRKTGQAMYLKNFLAQTEELKKTPSMRSAENGGYPPTQNGDIRSLFKLFTLLAMQN